MSNLKDARCDTFKVAAHITKPHAFDVRVGMVGSEFMLQCLEPNIYFEETTYHLNNILMNCSHSNAVRGDMTHLMWDILVSNPVYVNGINEAYKRCTLLFIRNKCFRDLSSCFVIVISLYEMVTAVHNTVPSQSIP